MAAHGQLRGRGHVLGEPEVEHLDLALAREHDVAGLEVAVDEVVRVRCRERGCRVAHDARCLVQVEPALSAKPALQTLAIDVLHLDELILPLRAHCIYRGDVGVIEHGRGPRLALEALPGIGAFGRQLGRQELERDRASQLHVLGLVDRSHAALAELLEDLVLPDLSADERVGRGVGFRVEAEPLGRGLARRLRLEAAGALRALVRLAGVVALGPVLDVAPGTTEDVCRHGPPAF